ncbi:DUF72 domain-containing protein [Polyangium aurulentum]|uniref:DUF72 domain-containing protein n=1 Tax=Polyangium aurulentum TaxID=2567896 RepID=UPI00146C471A|nr:DUF72 domain-containing protein [Polyangium aurulentum]UQA59757.1 DUF72 domain-containing protein [Polyangium aurulentum]
MKQLDLFGGPSEPDLPNLEADRALAARLPQHVLLGTSTWTFPGWRGVLYPRTVTEREIVAHGLRLYAQNPLFRTVGIDRSYYAPLSDEELARYRADLPDGFPCAMKVWSGIVSRHDPRTGAPNPTFLDPRAFETHVLGPAARSFARHTGVLLFVLSPMRAVKPAPEELAEGLDRFFEAVPRSLRCAVELRNPELLSGAYLRTLARHGVSHVLGLWERMPSIGRQLAVPAILTAPLVICRLSIRPGDRYEERKRAMAPFDRIVDVDETTRGDVVTLARRCAAERRSLMVLVNNKVEGCAPLTVRALAQRIVDGA